MSQSLSDRLFSDRPVANANGVRPPQPGIRLGTECGMFAIANANFVFRHLALTRSVQHVTWGESLSSR